MNTTTPQVTSVKDANGKDIQVGDRVMFNCSECVGHGELGTVTNIERDCVYNQATGTFDLPWGDENQWVLWVKWDCHGKETGEALNLLSGSRMWLFNGRQTSLSEVAA